MYIFGDYCGVQSAIRMILHGIGFMFENNREDRDSFISMEPEVMETAMGMVVFYKDGTFNLGPYDFNSIMHFHLWVVPLTGGMVCFF